MFFRSLKFLLHKRLTTFPVDSFKLLGTFPCLSTPSNSYSHFVFPSGKESFYARGTEYEQFVVQTLKQISIDGVSCGGPGDKGIDFSGSWILPDSSFSPIPVVGQCKRVKSRIKPASVRELESVVANRPKNTIGILVSSSGYTKATISQYHSSSLPLVLLTIFSPSDCAPNSIDQPTSCTPQLSEFLLNRPASEIFKNKLIVTKAFSRSRNPKDSNLLVLFNGKPFKSIV